MNEAQREAVAHADAQQIAEYLQTIPAALLAAVAQGRVDMNKLAADELASRGLNEQGKWVGFDTARAA